MRLFLSSYRVQGQEQALMDIFGRGAKVAVINNSKDGKPAEERQQKLNEVLIILKNLGFKPKELDLRDYFNDNSKLKKELSKNSAVWAAGGNTFILRRALQYSGCFAFLYDMVRKNELAYGGDSAGAILATPSLHGSEYGDEPDLIPNGYKKEIIWEGLNFVSYHIVPHYKSDWWGIEADKMIDDLKKKGFSYRTLKDGQAIVINGDKEEFLA